MLNTIDHQVVLHVKTSSHPLGWPEPRQMITSVDQNGERLKPVSAAVRAVKQCSCFGTQFGGFSEN